jgi:hypothetical protein
VATQNGRPSSARVMHIPKAEIAAAPGCLARARPLARAEGKTVWVAVNLLGGDGEWSINLRGTAGAKRAGRGITLAARRM